VTRLREQRRSKQLKTGAVARVDIKNDAVNGAKVAKDGLTGDDITRRRSASRLGPQRRSAAHANATGVARQDRIPERRCKRPGAPNDTTHSARPTAACDGGQIAQAAG
jgi:hypothetical protein